MSIRGKGLLAGMVALGMLALGLVLLLWSQPTTGASVDPVGGNFPRPGTAAPDFSAPDLQGQVVQLSALRGKPVWINFWATWCPPCKEEMPLMEQQYRANEAAGLTIVGVNMQETPETVRAWVKDRFHWRFVLDTDLSLANLLQVEGLPQHLFIDRQGVVREVHIGAMGAAQMDAALATILAR